MDTCSSAVPVAPDGGYGWVIVAASFIFHAMVDGTFSVHGVFLPQLTDYFGVGRGRIAVIGSVMGGCLLLSGPLVSVFVNWCGSRKVAVTGGALTAIGLFMSAFVPNATMLIVTMGCITGLGLGMLHLPAVVTVGCYFERRRALASGICSSGSGVGMVVLAPLLALLLNLYDWKNALVFVSGIALHTIVFAALLRPLEVKVVTNSYEETKIPEETGKENGEYSHLDSSPTTDVNIVNENGPITDAEKKYRENGLHVSNIKDMKDSLTGNNITGSCTLFESKRNSHVVCDRKYCSSLEISHDLRNKERLLETKPSHSHDVLVSKRTVISPLLLRKDIFYSGSIANIPNYRPHYQEKDTCDAEGIHVSNCCGIQSQSYGTIRKLLDASLLTNSSMLVIAIANAFFQMGYIIPIVFISDYGISQSIGAQKSALFVALYGVALLLGRGIGGIVGNIPHVNPLYVTITSQLIAGILCFIVPFCGNFFTISLCIFTIAFMQGPIVPLTTVFLVDYLGINHLTNAVGILSMAKGFVCFFGAPIAGMLLDVTGSYLGPFGFAGGLFLLSGICFFFLPLTDKPSL